MARHLTRACTSCWGWAVMATWQGEDHAGEIWLDGSGKVSSQAEEEWQGKPVSRRSADSGRASLARRPDTSATSGRLLQASRAASLGGRRSGGTCARGTKASCTRAASSSRGGSRTSSSFEAGTSTRRYDGSMLSV